MKKYQKPKIIMIYGGIAVGKLTTARELAKLTGFRLFHNHLVVDLAGSVFERSEKERFPIMRKVSDLFLREAIRCEKDIVLTFAYAYNFIHPDGTHDWEHLKKKRERLVRYGADVYMVHLVADTKEMTSRVGRDSRKEFGKLTSKKVLSEYHKTMNWETSVPISKNHIKIDNTSISAKKVAKKIQEEFKI